MEGSTYFSIKLERKSGGESPIVLWLCRISPQAWGDRERAIKFVDKGEARRAAQSIKLAGAWSIEGGSE
jgi:hypothetical protein